MNCTKLFVPGISAAVSPLMNPDICCTEEGSQDDGDSDRSYHSCGGEGGECPTTHLSLGEVDSCYLGIALWKGRSAKAKNVTPYIVSSPTHTPFRITTNRYFLPFSLSSIFF